MNDALTHVLIDAVLFKALGGLGIFLLGMKFMSEGMQAVAGNGLRKLIASVTNNRLAACMVGTAVTCVIQSSSVTSVMVIGFVNAGFMTLLQAIGVIIGANVGTTITGWILALKIGKAGLPIIGIAAFVYLFSKNERARYIAMAFVGIGMVFFGLETMAAGFKDPQVKEALTGIFSQMSGASYPGALLCMLVGCIATMIVQSSSATLGITIALASTGVVDFSTAAALIVGLNIGTTITAFLASLGSTTNAKRAAYAHIIFNVIGSIWVMVLFYGYVAVMNRIGDAVNASIEARIALTHTCFNVINTIIFLPLMGILARVVTRMVPDKPHKETPHLTFLDIRMLDTPAIGIQQSFVEILKMGEHVQKMFPWLKETLSAKEPDRALVKKIFHREEIIDVVQKEIVEYLSQILSGNIPHDVVASGRQQLRISDELESISDYLATILKLFIKLQDQGLTISAEGLKEIILLHDEVAIYTQMITDAIVSSNADILSKARTQGDSITHTMKDARARHLDRVEAQHVSAMKSLIFTDMLTAYRKIKDHGLNIAETLAGDK